MVRDLLSLFTCREAVHICSVVPFQPSIELGEIMSVISIGKFIYSFFLVTVCVISMSHLTLRSETMDFALCSPFLFGSSDHDVSGTPGA